MTAQGNARATATLRRVLACRLARRAVAEESRHATARARPKESEGPLDGKGPEGQRTACGIVGAGIALGTILGRDGIPAAALEAAGQVEGLDLATRHETQVRMKSQRILEQRTSHALALHDIEDDDGAHVP